MVFKKTRCCFCMGNGWTEFANYIVSEAVIGWFLETGGADMYIIQNNKLTLKKWTLRLIISVA